MRRLTKMGIGLTLVAVLAGWPVKNAWAARGRAARHVVVVHDDFPLHRTWPTVLDRRPGVAIRVAPRTFTPALVWNATLAVPPSDNATMWNDAETLDPDDDWTETVFDVNDPGSRLVIGIDGQVALDWAEIVFSDGSTQVIDFKVRTATSGLYALLDFGEIRRVDHIRVMALALSPSAAVTLRLGR